MTLAVITQNIIPTTVTQSSFMSGIATGMINAGFTSISSYTLSSVQYQIFKYEYNNTTKGTVYILISINTSLQLSSQLLDSWDIANKTGTNGTVVYTISYVFLTSNQITINAVNHPEFRGIFIQQTGNANILTSIGSLRPANKPAWWNESLWLYAFLPLINSAPNNFNQWLFSSNNPFNTPSSTGIFCTFMTNAAFANANPNNGNNFSLVTGLVLCQPTQAGYVSGEAGTTSTDICFGAANNKNFLDVWDYSGSIYTLISDGGSPAFGIKTT